MVFLPNLFACPVNCEAYFSGVMLKKNNPRNIKYMPACPAGPADRTGVIIFFACSRSKSGIFDLILNKNPHYGWTLCKHSGCVILVLDIVSPPETRLIGFLALDILTPMDYLSIYLVPQKNLRP